MKRFFSLLLAALLCAALVLPLRSAAASDYDLAYDATEQMDPSFMYELGTNTFYRLTDSLDAQVRVDIVTGLEGETIEDYAQAYYDAYNYGVGTDRSCILLMIQCHEDDTGLAYDDYYVLTAGGAKDVLTDTDMLALLSELNPYLSADAWSGDRGEDVQACQNALSAYAGFLSELGGGAASLIAPAPAEGETQEPGLISPSAASISADRYVNDTAGLLTDEQLAQLEQMAAEASAKYNSGVYVVTVNDYRDYNSESPYEAAKTIFTQGGFGLGDDQSGTMLLLSMDARDYAYIARGEFGNYAFTDYGKKKVEKNFLDDFSNDDWYSGFYDFIDDSDSYMAKAAAGEPVDVEHISTGTAAAGSVALGAAASCAGSAIRCSGLKKKMKTVKTKADATQYMAAGIAGAAGGLILRASTDQFINTTFQRVPLHVNDDDGRGGWSGGTTIDSGGFSGHSGKF